MLCNKTMAKTQNPKPQLGDNINIKDNNKNKNNDNNDNNNNNNNNLKTIGLWPLRN